MPTITIRVPDIGEFEDVEVIEVLVAAGDRVEVEDSLITLESDKASMEVPSPRAGLVGELRVALGDSVSEGSEILTLELSEAEVAADAAPDGATAARTAEPRTPAPAAAPLPTGGPAPSPSSGPGEVHAEVVVIGSGPGGYSAAFRAADLGKEVVLVERYPTLGGVCLNVGCIPSKALLHMAAVISEARELAEHGIGFGDPDFDLDKIRARVNESVRTLTGGLIGLAKQRKVRVVHGSARFAAPDLLEIDGPHAPASLSFDSAVIAVGSRAIELPDVPDDPRVMDSTAALELAEVPARLLVIGGGIIGLEMATVYDALGSEITVVELLDGLIPGADPDIVRPLQRRIQRRYANILLGTRVMAIEPRSDALRVHFEGKRAPETADFDSVLVAVGRAPNGGSVDAEKAGVRVDERGFIPVDTHMRTNVPHIFAIGDVAGHPMLAHKAVHEGKTAAEVIAGLPSAFDASTVPSVAYTDPEVAWMGLTEQQAAEQGIEVEKATFPWAASGRSLSLGRKEGLTKLLFSRDSGRLVGAGIVGTQAGELIAETVLALELGADAEDLALTIHSHPTLSETIGFAAEIAHGTITDLYLPKRR